MNGGMDRAVNVRRPDPQSHVGRSLSKISKLFFSLDILQVIVVGTVQGTMMMIGDFKAIKDGGMGPGRRVYMALFAGAVIYTCFLCLFAVRKENFLEIIAFVTQNFGFITYGFVQVYHYNFKDYESIRLKRDERLKKLVVFNLTMLIVFNVAFTYLAFQLYNEYGWKIYKRVRFNVRLRAAYHYYELVICLMKMVLLFVLMFVICFNQTILRDHTRSVNYFIRWLIIPITLLILSLAVFGIRQENRIIVGIFVILLILCHGLLIYELYSVGAETCNTCRKYFQLDGRVNSLYEVKTHLYYLSITALLLVFMLIIATLKLVTYFGIGLKNHFVNIQKNSTAVLAGLPGELMKSIFHRSQSDLTIFNEYTLNETVLSNTALKRKASQGNANVENSDDTKMSIDRNFEVRETIVETSDSTETTDSTKNLNRCHTEKFKNSSEKVSVPTIIINTEHSATLVDMVFSETLDTSLSYNSKVRNNESEMEHTLDIYAKDVPIVDSKKNPKRVNVNTSKQEPKMLNVKDAVRANSLPDAKSKPRPSVFERLSQQASQRLNRFYQRNMSIDSSAKNNEQCCECIAKTRRNSAAYEISNRDTTKSNNSLNEIAGNEVFCTSHLQSNNKLTEFHYNSIDAFNSSDDTIVIENESWLTDNSAKYIFTPKKHDCNKTLTLYSGSSFVAEEKLDNSCQKDPNNSLCNHGNERLR